MAPRRLLIDSEWAEKLIGIQQVIVPNHWWQGCKGRKLWTGVVVSFNVDQQKWMFVLDDSNKEYEQYGLNYCNGIFTVVDSNFVLCVEEVGSKTTGLHHTMFNAGIYKYTISAFVKSDLCQFRGLQEH